MTADSSKIIVSQEDVARLFATHKAWMERKTGTTKEQVQLNARLHMEYRKICVELGDKYGYDPTNHMVTLEGKVIPVTVRFKQ